MQNTINALNTQLGLESFGLIVYKGKLVPLGKGLASELKYGQNGKLYWKGFVSYEKTEQGKNGKTYTKKNIKSFTAFGDLAVQLGQLQEGNVVMLIAEDTKQKGQDGKWYENAIVQAFDVLG